MPDDLRGAVALIVAMAAHVERNTPQVFPPATTDRIEDAADELLSDAEPVSFETRMVVVRMLQSIQSRVPNRPWGSRLRDELLALVQQWGGPLP